MRPWLRALRFFSVLVWCVLLAAPASAWMDLRVASDVATVEVARDGSARVRHEMLLRVRGGPLKEFVVNGIDGDAVPVEGATLVKAKSGRAAGVPIALLVEREDDLLTLKLTYKKGVRTGSYLVQFEYETDVARSELLTVMDDHALLRWRSPRFDDGIDSLKARFVVPRADPPPRLARDPDAEAGDQQDVALLATDDGVFLSELRREETRDTLELTRPHVARGEEVEWGVAFSRDAFTTLPAAEASSPAPPTSQPRVAQTRGSSKSIWLGGALVGLGFCLLLWGKHRWFRGLRGRRTTSARFVMPGPAWLRLPVVLMLICAAGGTGLALERADWASGLLFAAAMLSLQVARPEKVAARGPGAWNVVDQDALFSARTRMRGFFRVLDVSTVLGFLLLASIVAVLCVFALRNIGTAPYRSAALIAATVLPLALFVPLGGARLGRPLLDLQRQALLPIVDILNKRRVAFDVLARTVTRPLATPEVSRKRDRSKRDVVDEYRIRFQLTRPKGGFDSLELALECSHGGWFFSAQPVLIARVREGSRAHDALPHDAEWSRGRHRDERIALIRPRLPLVPAAADEAKRLLHALTDRGGAQDSPRRATDKKASRSSGSPLATSKAATARPPA